MTPEQINALTVETAFSSLIVRLIDFSNIQPGTLLYTLEGDGTLYERLVLNENANPAEKPTLQAFEAELEALKAELLITESTSDLFNRQNNARMARKKRYQVETDHLHIDAFRESFLEDNTKLDAYVLLINQIKADIPIPIE